ncbi:MAG: MBOAT family protein, partial [Planctomycetota bacterium]
MLFNSYIFIFAFLPATLILYVIASRVHVRAAIATLVVASLFYYGWWAPRYVFLILFSILFNYALGFLLASEDRPRRAKKRVLALGVAVNLGLLAYFKYAMFIADNLSALLDTPINIGTIVLPLAISFFTFQQIAYLVDAFRGLTREYSFVDYCLFVTFFPQLIAGPIVHHGEMLPQFADRRTARPSADNLTIGLSIFAAGLFKKVVIADGVSVTANKVFDAAAAGGSVTFVDAWAGALAYTMQLYFDFSGYSDMAIGLGRMFGIRLPVNFDSPYKARSIVDFWRRWHITLSRFLRDYLYIPLGGNRRG